MERLDGKKIIITGGASGMGRSIVEGFPSLGANVVFFDVNDEAGNETAKKSGTNYIHVDVSDEQSVKEGFEETAKYLGGIDVLIHAAAIAPFCPAELITLDEWNKVYNINATGTFLTNKAAFPYMKEKGGHIINFISASAMLGYVGKSHYAASKGAVTSWTRSLAKEWMRYFIRVNMIAPCIWTPMFDKTRAAMTPEQLKAFDQTLVGMCLGDKLGDPDTDFLPVMAFMASDSSKFITGQVISIDGGVMMVR